MENLVERLRDEAGRDDLAYRTVTVLMDAALKIEQLESPVRRGDGAQFSRKCSCAMCRSYFNSTPTV